MKILVLTNFYPPLSRGGYDQWCQEVSELLMARGHEVTVVTSNHMVEGEQETNGYVQRVLHLDADIHHYRPLDYWQERPGREAADIERLSAIVEACQPDIAFVWGMWNFSRTLPCHLEQAYEFPVVYYVSDHWPADPDPHEAYWNLPADRWYMKAPKRLASALIHAQRRMNGRPPALRFDHAMVVSRAMLESIEAQGVAFSSAEVLHGGTDVGPLLACGRDLACVPKSDAPLKLIYSGALEAHKGVHTAIEALALLAAAYAPEQLSLSIVGSGSPAYAARLDRLIQDHALEAHIRKYAWVNRDEMPQILGSHDVLLFTSTYEEPFARMVLEGMAAGLTVVGTTTGGSKEILADGKNALTYAAGDAQQLATCIRRLIDDRGLQYRLADAGRRIVVERYTLQRMTDDIEAALYATLKDRIQ